MQRPMENAFIDASERSRSSAVWNVRLRFLTSVVILVALGLQIGVACLSVNDYEIWSSPESFAFVGSPFFLLGSLSFAYNFSDWIVHDLEHGRIHCSIPEKEGNSSRRPCGDRSDPLDGTVQFRAGAGSGQLLFCPPDCSWDPEARLQVRCRFLVQS